MLHPEVDRAQPDPVPGVLGERLVPVDHDVGPEARHGQVRVGPHPLPELRQRRLGAEQQGTRVGEAQRLTVQAAQVGVDRAVPDVGLPDQAERSSQLG